MLWFKKKEKSELEKDIDIRIEKLDDGDDVDEDAKKIKNIKDLVEVKEKLEGSKKSIDCNVIISVAGALLGTGAILWHEKLDVVTSKALPIVQRMFKL